MKDTRKSLYANMQRKGGKLLIAALALGTFSCANDATTENINNKETLRTELLTHAAPNTASLAQAELNEKPSPIKVNIPAATDQLLIKVMKDFNANLGFEEKESYYTMNTAQGTFQCYTDYVRMNMWKRDQSMIAAQEAAANGNMAGLMEMSKEGLVMDMRWMDATASMQQTDKKLGIDKMYQVVSKGGDSKKVSQYKDLVYNKLYSNIDVRYTRMDDGALAYDLVAYGTANVNAARFMLDGATDVRVGEKGSLLINTPIGEMRQTAPLAYQTINGQKVNVDVTFVVNEDKSIGFQLGEYDATKAVVIGTVVFDWSAVAGGDAAYGLALSPHPQGGKIVMGSQLLPQVPAKVGAYKAAANEGYTNFLVQVTESGDMKSITYFATR